MGGDYPRLDRFPAAQWLPAVWVCDLPMQGENGKGHAFLDVSTSFPAWKSNRDSFGSTSRSAVSLRP